MASRPCILRWLLPALLTAGAPAAPAVAELSTGDALFHLAGWDGPAPTANFNARNERSLAIRRDRHLFAVVVTTISPAAFGTSSVTHASGRATSTAWAQFRATLAASSIARAHGRCHLVPSPPDQYAYVVSWFGGDGRQSQFEAAHDATAACPSALSAVVTRALVLEAEVAGYE